MKTLKLLPRPRVIERAAGELILPPRVRLALDAALPVSLASLLTERLEQAGKSAGVRMAGSGKKPARGQSVPGIWCGLDGSLVAQPESYTLTIARDGIRLTGGDAAGLRAGMATLRQLLRQHGRRLPCLTMRDWPDFARRGYMLDVSRGRVPNLATLLDLAERLADFKINELQLYTEHTFAYQAWRPVWESWGALTAEEIQTLDERCRWLGIDLVPNQNSFGHLREWLAHPPLKPLAEVAEPYEGANGEFLRYPGTLAPNHPGTLPFLRGLYDELLPNFSSRYFNVGCDETWDLGRGQSRAECERLGQGRVYLEFLKKIAVEVKQRGRTMMFWGDIILNHPELIPELPKEAIALNWGYEAEHPFEEQTALFQQAGIPYYVCPGTSTWMTLIGKHDNGFANLGRAAAAGRANGARGYLITDWGDGGHPQPLAVSWPLIVAGAALSWCGESYDDQLLAGVLSRDIFEEPDGKLARAGLALGRAHQKLKLTVVNETPLGTAITAPPPEQRELFCRNGLKHFAKIPASNIRAARREIAKQSRSLGSAAPRSPAGWRLAHELILAAGMALLSCDYMLWQQAVAAGKRSAARKLAAPLRLSLRHIHRKFNRYWPKRNKGTPLHCSGFLEWRLRDLED